MDFLKTLLGVFSILYGIYFSFYGLTMFYKKKQLRYWSLKRCYYLFAYSLVGLGIILAGVGLLLDDPEPLYFATLGLGILAIIPAPCGDPAFNDLLMLKIVRGVVFCYLSFSIIFYSIF